MHSYLYITDVDAWESWIAARYPDGEGGLALPREAVEIWTDPKAYPLRDSGEVGEMGSTIYERDPTRTDCLVLCVVHDTAFSDEVSALPYVTAHVDCDILEIKATYPDHEAFGNIIPYTCCEEKS